MATIDKLLGLLDIENVASKLSAEKRTELAEKVIKGYQIDRNSRSGWEERCEEAIKFVKQITNPKDFPWEGSANTIYPILTVASHAFAARTYPEIVKGQRIVKCSVFGRDPEGSKSDRAERVSAHMSYQRLVQSDTWEPDTDKLLHMLPVIGTCFRKVYYDPIDEVCQSDLCDPSDIVVNHNIASLEKAQRVTHRYLLNKNEVIEKMRSKYYIDMDVERMCGRSPEPTKWDTALDDTNTKNEFDGDMQIEFLEQHMYCDLDGDGYAEPWIVVVCPNVNEVVGIYPRFDINDIKVSDKGEILKITPTQYFIDYHFLPSPDGGFYSLGYGHLLYTPIQAINTLMNQLLDSGSLANTSCGLLSRSLKLKGGALKLQPGEYVPVDPGSTGKVADSIHEMQFKQPSPVLLQLLQILIASTERMASINEIMTGDAKPQNAPANSVAEMSNQGMKIFSSVAKRLYRSLKKEFNLIYKFNALYLDEQVYFNFHDDQRAISRMDYRQDDMDIVPVADPTMGAEAQKGIQANAINTLMQNQAALGELKVNNVVRELFETLRIPEDKINELLLTPEEKQQMMQQQPPDINQQKLELDRIKAEKDFAIKSGQLEKANKEMSLKELDLVEKYKLKRQETDEKQARMMADAMYKRAQADTMDEKLKIERDKVEVMKQKANQERKMRNDT